MKKVLLRPGTAGLKRTVVVNQLVTLRKKWSFQLRVSSVNVTKSAGNCGFGNIYWRNL